MNENDSSQVRQFLASQAGKTWLEEGKNEYPRMNRKEAISIELYNSGLQYNEGWRDAIDNLVAKVRSQAPADYGVPYIEPSRD